jgi:hypothetical protein
MLKPVVLNLVWGLPCIVTYLFRSEAIVAPQPHASSSRKLATTSCVLASMVRQLRELKKLRTRCSWLFGPLQTVRSHLEETTDSSYDGKLAKEELKLYWTWLHGYGNHTLFPLFPILAVFVFFVFASKARRGFLLSLGKKSIYLCDSRRWYATGSFILISPGLAR